MHDEQWTGAAQRVKKEKKRLVKTNSLKPG